MISIEHTRGVAFIELSAPPVNPLAWRCDMRFLRLYKNWKLLIWSKHNYYFSA